MGVPMSVVTAYAVFRGRVRAATQMFEEGLIDTVKAFKIINEADVELEVTLSRAWKEGL